MTEKHTEKPRNALYLLMLLPIFMFGLMGALLEFIGDSSPLSGFLWGIGIGTAICVAMIIGMFGWEWLNKEAEAGKSRPFMIGGILVAIAISSYLALSLGSPTCIDSTDTDNRGSTCLEYADDGYEATTDQKWNKFWSTLPVTIIICLLIAYIVHTQYEKNRPKHYKSEKDGFSVDIFPETISVDLDEDGNSYKYSQSYGPKYIIEVTPLDDFPISQHKAMEAVVSWHKNIVSAATKVSVDKVDYSEGEKQHTPYVYGSYPLKKDVTYYHLTLEKYGKIYSLTMYIQPLEYEDKAQLDKIFFQFVDSFKFNIK